MTLTLLPSTLASAFSGRQSFFSTFRSARYAVAVAPGNQAGTSRNSLQTGCAACVFGNSVRRFVRAVQVGFLPSGEYNTRYSGTPLTRTTRGSTVRIPRMFCVGPRSPGTMAVNMALRDRGRPGKGRIWASPGAGTAAEVTQFQGTNTKGSRFAHPSPNLRPRRFYRLGSVVFLLET